MSAQPIVFALRSKVRTQNKKVDDYIILRPIPID